MDDLKWARLCRQVGEKNGVSAAEAQYQLEQALEELWQMPALRQMLQNAGEGEKPSAGQLVEHLAGKARR